MDLIYDERNSFNQYEASNDEVKYRKTLEDYVKLWLINHINNRVIAAY
jgi:hemerythrin